MDKLQEVLENRMALLDVAPSDPPRLPKVSPEVAEATEDFFHTTMSDLYALVVRLQPVLCFTCR